MALPGYGFNPQNALLNFDGINQAIGGYRKGMEEERVQGNNVLIGNKLANKDYDGASAAAGQAGDVTAALGITKFKGEMDDREIRQRHAKLDELGRMAQAAQEIKDPRQQQAVIDHIFSQHPSKDTLDPIYRTPQGLGLIASQAAGAKTMLERQMQQAQLNNLNMQTVTASNADKRAKMQLEQDTQLNNMLFPKASPAPAAATPAPSGQPMAPKPMSMEGAAPQSPQNALYAPQAAAPPEMPQGDPNIVRVADTATAAPPAPAAAPPSLVDTPTGKMTAERANQMGMAWSMKKNHDMAKMYFDAAKKEASNLSKGATELNDKNELGYVNHLGRLSDMEQQINDKHFEWGSRLKLAGSALTEKLGGKLTPEKQAALVDYTKFRSEAITNFNALLKEASGTAVTENEFKRMALQEPSAGTGIFDADSATEFKSKLAQGKKNLQLAIARANYLRKNAFEGQPFDGKITDAQAAKVPLSGMERIIDKTGEQLHRQLRAQNPKLPNAQIESQVRAEMAKQFGVDT